MKLRLGDTEEWTVWNEDSQYHDSHIHQTGFLVTAVNGSPAHFDGLPRHVQRSAHEEWQARRREAHNFVHESGNCR